MHVLGNRPSVVIAKERLKTLIVSDRVHCKPDTYELLYNELYRTVAKYMTISEEQFDVQITHSEIYIKLTGEKV